MGCEDPDAAGFVPGGVMRGGGAVFFLMKFWGGFGAADGVERDDAVDKEAGRLC